MAATVWVDAFAGVDAVGFEEEEDPQPAVMAAATNVARASLSRVIVIKDARPEQMLPLGILAGVHMTDLTAPEQRVLGCLIEKRFTTPDQYPLSLNALRLACNQSTNRDPVTHYDEPTVRAAAERLTRYGLVRLASGHGSRATKYRHLADEVLGLSREQMAVLAVLLLRGPQTPGELRQRTERMAPLDSPTAVEQVLDALIERGYAARLERRPGQKEERFSQLLGGGDGTAPAATVPEPSAQPDLEERVARLEREVAELRAALTGEPAPSPERAGL